jgi:hypothetical protein
MNLDGGVSVDTPSNKYKVKGKVPEGLELARERKLPMQFRAELEDARSLRFADVAIWDYGLAFLLGNQELVVDRLSLDPTRARELKGKVTAVTNRILPAYRSTVAAFSPQMPSMSARSLSAAYEGEMSAISANMAARALWLQADMEWAVRKAVEWCSPCGNVGLHVWANQTKEKIEVDVVSPYDLLFEAYATRPELARWSAVRKFVRREEAIDLFPDAEDFFEEAQADSGDGDAPDGATIQPSDRLEMWWVYYKDGRCGVWCQSQWVYESDYPDWCDPVILIRWTPMPNRIWGISQIMPAIIPQLRYNQIDELLFQIMKIASSPQWIVSRQAMVDKRSLNNNPGQVIEYNDSGREPALRQAPPAPASLWDALAMQSAKIEDMMGAHSASQGKRVPNVSSGIGMETLIGQDDANLGLTQSEFQRAFEQAVKTGLVLMKHYMPSRMLIRVPGRASSSVMRAIETVDLSDKPDVVFGVGSMFAVNARSRDQQMLNLVQYGLPIAEVVPHLSFKIDEHAEFERLQHLFFARSMLDAMLEGSTVQWVPIVGFMDAVEQIFGDFIRSPQFYLDRQELVAAAQQEQQAAQQAAQQAMMMGQPPAQEQPLMPGQEPEEPDSIGPATDTLQALQNIWVFYQDVVMQKAQMVAGSGGGGQPGGMASPAGPGGGGGGGGGGQKQAAPAGQPGAPDPRKGQQNGNASNGSQESDSAVAFKSGGRRGAP